MRHTAAVLTIVLVLSGGVARQARAADAAQGADLFDENCSECHSVAKSLRNKKGPALFGVIGRSSATVPGFSYSDALKAKNLVWTRENLDAYIAHPKQLVPGGKMKFDGLDDAGERADIIEFLAHPQ